MHNPTYESVLRLLLDAGCAWDEADRLAREMSSRRQVMKAAA